jgi:hypothetical protein
MLETRLSDACTQIFTHVIDRKIINRNTRTQAQHSLYAGIKGLQHSSGAQQQGMLLEEGMH